jgi:hypothetical protein
MNTDTRIAFGKASKVVVALTILVGALGIHVSGANAEDSRTFPETDKTVSGTFLDYWDTHGGLAQQGYPISEEMEEASDTDGQTYTVQYFQRAVFEKHPENAAPYDVLLSLLGSNLYKSKYNDNAPGQQASETNARTFPETGKTLGGVFREYWEQHGGLAQQGYPISNEFQEIDKDGVPRTVQYFERAVFELHPENAGKPSEVLLSLLGTFRYEGGTGNGGTPPTPPDAPAGLNVPGWTHITVTANKIAIFYNATTGAAITARLGTDGSLTLLQRYPDESKGHDEFGKGRTEMQAAPDNRVLFYNSSDGDFMFLKVADDGQVSQALHYTGFGSFSKSTIDPVSGITFYQDKDRNTTTVDGLTPEGFPYNIKAEGPATGGIADDLMVPIVLGGLWYDYAPDTGQVNVYTIDAKGELVGAAISGNVGKGVTHIVSNYYSHVLFYNKSDAVFLTAKITSPNGVAQVQITNAAQAEKNWSIVAATQSPIIICADEKGNIQTYVLVDSGYVVPLKMYEAGK